jgi:hypothetical protein
MNKRYFYLLLAFPLVWFFFSCSNKSKNSDTDSQTVDSLLRQDTIRDQIQQFVHIFPSQLKVARLFKNAGLKYQAMELMPEEAGLKLVSEDEKALAMGLYGVDMVYSAMNNQTQAAMNNLKVSRDLAKDLGLESVYSSNNYVQKFERNLNNQDSLESIIRDLFAETDAFLKDNNKLDLTLFTFAGGWTESVYLAAVYARSTKNKGIVQLIGDQLVSLDPLIDLLKETRSASDTRPIISELENIRKAIRAGIVKDETETEPMIIEMDESKLNALITQLNIIRNRVSKAKK